MLPVLSIAIRRVACAALTLLCAVAPLTETAHAGANLAWHQRLKKGPKMDISAATFFGAAGHEEFVGVTETSQGRIVAYGNSWGPPFPETVAPTVLGSDSTWQVTFFPPGKEKDEEGKLLPTPESNPNRTGFILFYSDDLARIEKVVRFGWGVASITAAEIMSDNSVMIAGTATRNFRTVADSADLLKTYPKRRYAGYGPYQYDGTVQPGDCYVAKLDQDLKRFEWIWIFEGHRVPPERLYEGPDGVVVFECRTLKCITPDGRKMKEIMKIFSTARRMFCGISPLDGNILVGGDYHHSTGREPWRKPVLDLYSFNGKPYARFYDWHGPLVGTDWFRLVSDSAVRAGCFMPNGDILVYLWSDGGNTVASRNPVDLRKGVANTGLRMSMAGATVGSFCHIVRINPNDYQDCSYTLWAAYLSHKPNSIFLDRLAGAGDGKVMVAGRAAGFLVQTTTRWFRAGDHYHVNRDFEGKVVGYRYRDNGWPDYVGVGGRGEFSAVFSPGFTNVLWSSCVANAQHTAMLETRRGVVAVSRCVGPAANDGRKPFFEEHDIAHWVPFLSLLREKGAAEEPSAARRVWTRINEDIRKEMAAIRYDREVTEEFRLKVFDELNRILFEARDLYDADAWRECSFTHYERKLLARLTAGEITDDQLTDLNRRLFEKVFPTHVFACPKANRPPVLNAVQDEFGGGHFDGHIYLLEDVKKPRIE